MTIGNAPHLFSLLSKNLYKDPIKAGIREIITNAWDAHIAAGIDTPIQLTQNEGYFTVRDYGSGIPRHKFQELFGTVGGTNKRDNASLTGGMGIGKMAPLAFLDYFTVTSRSEGIRTTYHIQGPTEESLGVPTITEISSSPCLEVSGLEVDFPYMDTNNLVELATEVVLMGSIKAQLTQHNRTITLPTLVDADIALLTEGNRYELNIYVRLGNISYKIDKKVYKKILETEYQLCGELVKVVSIAPILKISPGSIQITPNREEIVYTEKTTEFLLDLVTEFLKKIQYNLDSILSALPVSRKNLHFISSSSGVKSLSWEDFLSDPKPNQVQYYRPYYFLKERTANAAKGLPTKLANYVLYTKHLGNYVPTDPEKVLRDEFINDFTAVMTKHGQTLSGNKLYCDGGTMYKPADSEPLQNMAQYFETGKMHIYCGPKIPLSDVDPDKLYIHVAIKTDKEALAKDLAALFIIPESNITIGHTIAAKKDSVKRKPVKYVPVSAIKKGKIRDCQMDSLAEDIVPDMWIPLSAQEQFWAIPPELYKDKVCVVATPKQEALFKKRTKIIVPCLTQEIVSSWLKDKLLLQDTKDFFGCLTTQDLRYLNVMIPDLAKEDMEKSKNILEKICAAAGIPVPSTLDDIVYMLCIRSYTYVPWEYSIKSNSKISYTIEKTYYCLGNTNIMQKNTLTDLGIWETLIDLVLEKISCTLP